MPWYVHEKEGQFCVCKKGSDTPIKGGCHSDKADAVKHMQALYAAEPSSMKYSVLSFTDDLFEDTDDPNVKWLKTWRYSTWEHPMYGKVEITPATGAQFKEHFDSGVFGRDLLVNFDHGLDAAKGGKTGGVVLDVDPREDGIYYKVEFTDKTRQEIEDKEWRYVSPEYWDWYIDKETGEAYENVAADLALTNTPFFKGQAPLNFSELYGMRDVEPKKEEKKTAVKPKGGSEVDELLMKFAEKLGVTISEDDTEDSILAKAETLNETIEPLRRTKEDVDRSRTFKEAFPKEWDRIQALEAKDVATSAKTFADEYSRFTIRDSDGTEYKSVYGFSELVKEKVASSHKKLSEREFRHTDLKELLDLIGDKGIVDYSERGSSRNEEGKQFSENPKLAFSEAVQDVMEKDELEYEDALRVAAQKYPKLYEAYFNSAPRH